MNQAPERGFSDAELEARCERAQRMMRELEVDALLLTTEPQVRYFSGFLTQFWHSPTRPWFLLVPLDGKPIAVIPTIGVAGMKQTWIDDIRSWSSPQPEDDGITLLRDAIKSLPRRFGRIGATLGVESILRMPVLDFERLRDVLPGIDFIDCATPLLHLACVKSTAEIGKIRYVAELASDSFNALPGLMQAGMSEREILRRMRIDLLERGADHTPYIVSASGPDGYGDIIMGPSDRVIEHGDVLIIDTGTVYDGYFCDFDRNYAFGEASDTARKAYDTVYRSTDAGFATAKPGATTTEVWQAMWSILEDGGAQGNDVGRMGHGLGAQLTEWPSLTATDFTVPAAGAATACSIFMASTTASTSPARTLSPGATLSLTTTPGSGAVMVPEPEVRC